VPEKRYLFTPGPTPVPPEVLAALAEPVVHHRGPDFKRIYARCLERLKAICRTEHDVLLFTAPGSAALESAVANLVSPGDRVAVVSAGYFGERFTTIARAFGADVVEVRYAWGAIPDAADLRSTLEESGGASVVYLTPS
jgi:serine---pyruvate transaminase